MPQLAQVGDQGLVNDLAGLTVPAVQAGAPTWFPGLYWVNTNNNSVNQWNGSAWVTVPTPGTRYLCLLTADPVFGQAINIGDPGFVELTTSGYARQPAVFSQASAAYPSVSSNTALITFGPMTASMLVPIQWVAMVTSGPAGGTTTGQFLASWNLSTPVQVNASQSIQIGVGQLVLQGQ